MMTERGKKARDTAMEAISLSICSIKEDIESNSDEKENLIRAVAIEHLTNAFNMLRRGTGEPGGVDFEDFP